MIDDQLLKILACPICKGNLNYNKNNNELICTFDRLSFPIINNIPVMLEEEARKVSIDE